MRFAFYGRVSTEDQQDPESSRAWQLTRSRAVIEPASGEIVAEYFDIGASRSLPWKRRPQSAALLEAFKNPGRDFSAVVVGEPARAFYGNQFGLTFPLFVHYGIALWVPEVGGAVDPGSDAHELVMALYGGMSKGERNRIKVRVRTAMATQAATEARFLGGRPPYGYRIADAGPHPNPGKAAVGQRRHRLEPDPVTASVVQRIFTEFLAGTGLRTIAERLDADAIPCPSAYDAARNPHRRGDGWQHSAVRAILINPRYTGHEVWNKQRKDEVLIDVDDVALGHETRLRWNEDTEWIWSPEIVHEPVIDTKTFASARDRLGATIGTGDPRRPRATPRPYVLRSRIRCGACDRLMEVTWNNQRAHYRCEIDPRRSAPAPDGHPKTVYVREDLITEPLDEWLAGLFDPEHIEATVDALHQTTEDPAEQQRRDAARQAIKHCDQRLEKYRRALDADVDPAVVGVWIAEVQAERNRHQAALGHTSGQRRLSRAEIHAIIAALGDIAGVLRSADPRDKREIYAQLGLELSYQHDKRLVTATARPGASMYPWRVRGGT